MCMHVDISASIQSHIYIHVGISTNFIVLSWCVSPLQESKTMCAQVSGAVIHILILIEYVCPDM